MAESHAKNHPQFQPLVKLPCANSDVGLRLLMFSRRDFLGGACTFLLPQLSRKSTDLKSSSALSPIRFQEIAQHAGLDFVLQNNPTPRKHMIETMSGGVAAFDYNNDGRADIFFTNGASIPSLEKDSPKFFNRLYRNDGGMRFTDVTSEAGVAGAGYSMGAAAADYNKTPDFDRYCGERDRNLRVYCHPKYFEGLPNTLYRNRRDGTFEDVTAKAGIASHIGRGMSVAFADYDNDGFTDVFVTNDNLPNFLFHNRRDGTFDEVALQAGVALTNYGLPVASMGADFRDFDNDGLSDLSVTALAGETFPLFQNLGRGSFQDATHKSRLAALSTTRSGWSNGFFDFNNDGWKDLFTANSDVNDLIDLFGSTHYKQTNSLFANLGNGTFRDVSLEAGFDLARAHRGSAFADFDNDGKIDVVVSALGEPAELWQNVSPDANRWITLKLTGSGSNREGIGAKIRLGKQFNHVTTAVGYASSSPSTVHFGTGKQEKIDRIEIRWPSDAVQVLRGVATNQVLEVREPSK